MSRRLNIIGGITIAVLILIELGKLFAPNSLIKGKKRKIYINCSYISIICYVVLFLWILINRISGDLLVRSSGIKSLLYSVGILLLVTVATLFDIRIMKKRLKEDEQEEEKRNEELAKES